MSDCGSTAANWTGQTVTATSGNNCIACPDGYTCEGDNVCPVRNGINCAAGTYIKANTTTCTACPAGNYCPGITTDSVTSTSSDRGITQCPAGSYCPAGSSNPKSCPTNYGNSAAGSDAASDCYTTCGVGAVVTAPMTPCVTPAGAWYSPSAHNVYYGKISPIGYCQYGSDSRNGVTSLHDQGADCLVTVPAGYSSAVTTSTARYIRISSETGVFPLAEVQAYNNSLGQLSLALGSSVTNGVNALDGSLATQAGVTTGSGVGAYAIFDLGSAKTITNIKFALGNVTSGYNIVIAISSDKSNWTTVFNQTVFGVSVLPGVLQNVPLNTRTNTKCTAGTYHGSTTVAATNGVTCTECPAAVCNGETNCASGFSTHRNTYPANYHSDDNLKLVKAWFATSSNTGNTSIEECKLSYSYTNNRGTFNQDSVRYQSSTGRYDGVGGSVYYTVLNPGYYGSGKMPDGYCDTDTNTRRHYYQDAVLCPAGKYCSGYTQMPLCSSGTYNDTMGIDGLLSGGYFSTGGAKKATPTSADCVGVVGADIWSSSVSPVKNVCGQLLPGYYSIEGAILPAPGELGAKNTAALGFSIDYLNQGLDSVRAGCLGSDKCGMVAAGYFSSGAATYPRPSSTGCVSGTCGICPAGAYSAAGATSCTACPALGGSNWTWNMSQGAGSLSACKRKGVPDGCSAGTVTDTATSATTWGNRVLNEWAAPGNTQIFAQRGYQIDVTNLKCTICPNGHYSGGYTSSCAPVNAGYYATGAATSPAPSSSEDCVTGTCGKVQKNCYGASGATSACPNKCSDLAYGTYPQSDEGADSPNKCFTPGSAMGGGYIATAGGPRRDCPLGTYKEFHVVYYGQTSRCTVCPSGTTTATQGAHNISSASCSAECTNADGVYEWQTPELSSDGGTVLKLCQAASCKMGHALASNQCNECPAGHYQPVDGYSDSICGATPAGYYNNEPGATEPLPCPAGQWSLAQSKSCTTLPAGYWNDGCGVDATGGVCNTSHKGGLVNAGYWNDGCGINATGGVCDTTHKGGQVNAGYYNLGGGTSATPEVRGKGCVNVSTTQCGTVAPGYWGAAGATQYGGSGAVAPGYFSTGGATSRTPSASGCAGKVAIIENGKLMGASDVDNTCGQVQAGYWNNACGINATGGVCSTSYQGGIIAAGYWGTVGATDSVGSGRIAPGYYSTGGATIEYPDPNQCVGNNTCGAIAAGYWNNGGGTLAAPTAPGNGCHSDKSCGTVNGGYYSTGGGTSATPTAASNGCLANKLCGKLSAIYYSNGGSTSDGATCVSGKTCGTCNANYRANTTTGKTSASQCQASCAAGTRVATVNAACTSPAGGWFSAAHLVNYGQISPVNYCMSGYTSASTSASGHDAKSDCVQTVAGGKYVPSSKINARYIKITSDGSVSVSGSTNPSTHLLEMQAFASSDGTGTNLLSGKGAVAGDKMSAVTNGNWTRGDGYSYGEGSPMILDLGSVQALGSLKFAMYTDGREYQNVVIAVSEDNTTYTTVFTANKLLTQNTTTPTGELVVLSAAPKSCAAGTSKASGTVALGNTTTCGTCANWTYSGAGAASCTACPAVESGYAKLDSTGTGWTTYQKCVEIATASPANCKSGKLQKIPTASGATTWATATVNANNPLNANPGYIVSGTMCSQCTGATYSAGGSATSCSACDPNYQANTTAGKSLASQCQISCAPGTAVVEKNKACAVLSGGKYKTGTALVKYGSLSPTATDKTSGWAVDTVYSCPSSYGISGTTAANHDARTDCTISCPAGTQVASENATCTTPSGTTWYTSGHSVVAGSTSGTNVKSCNSGYTTPNTTTQSDHDAAADCKISCEAGYYVPNAGQGCKICAPGKYCEAVSDIDQTKISAVTGDVTAGYYSSAGGTSATGTCLSGNSCGSCSTGTGSNGRLLYSNAGAASCSECPAATGTLASRVTGYSGWWSNNIHNKIGGCYANFSDSDDTATYRTMCYYNATDGTYGGENSSCQFYAPTACSGGYYSVIDKTSEWSTYGYASCKGADCMKGKVCGLTDAGSYSPDGATTQTKCVMGSYTDTTGQSACKACAGGKTNSADGATSCTADCSNATGVTGWETPVWDNTTNKMTNLCTVKATAGCLANYYKNSNACTACPSATYPYSVAGATAQTQCYANVTLNKNGFSGSIAAGLGTGCKVASTATGTNNATLQVYYNTECTLPTISGFTQTGYTAASGWASVNTIGASAVTKLPASTSKPAATYYARKTTCGADYYKKDATTCSTCASGTDGNYTKSAAGTASDVNVCYLNTTAKNFVKTPGAGQTTCEKGNYCPGSVKVYYGGTASDTHPTTGGSTQCLANSYCVAGVSEPVACSTLGGGLYKNSTAGASAAEDCNFTTTAGKYMVANTDTAQTTCPAKQYCTAETLNWPNVSVLNDGGWNDCPDAATHKRTSFPADYYSPTFASTSVTSSTGKGSISGCQVLNWLDSATHGGLYEYVNYNPNSGKYDTTYTYRWHSAKPGYYLTDKNGCGGYAYYQTIKECEPGSYCPGKNKVSCNKDNQATVHTDTFGIYSCSADTDGNYELSSGGVAANSINKCYLVTDVGDWVATANAAQTDCQADGWCPGNATVYYGSTGGRTACVAPYKFAAAGSDDANDCYLKTTAGQYVETAGAGQITCPAGYWCVGDVTIYKGGSVTGRSTKGGSEQCPAGYRDGTTGYSLQSQCTMNVLGGKYVKVVNESSASGTCDLGTYKPAHPVTYGKTSSCIPCPNATYAAQEGMSACEACPTATKYADKVVSYGSNKKARSGCYARFEDTVKNGETTYFSCYLRSGDDYGTLTSGNNCWTHGARTKCDAGYYSPVVPNAQYDEMWYMNYSTVVNNLCMPVESGYWSGADSLTRTACATGLVTCGAGLCANEAGDCGRKLHAGDNVIYLRSQKRTGVSPLLHLKVGDKMFYGNMSTSLSSPLKVKYNNTKYSVVNDNQ